MKFLFFTDTHIRGTTPRNRLDNYYETLKEKFHEVVSMSDKMQVDFILHGGDWFDRPDVSPAIVRDFAIIIKEFKMPVYTIAGNHDIYGHNPGTIRRTMLGLLEGTALLRTLESDDIEILEKGGVRVQLTGKPYSYDIDGEQYREYYCVKKRSDVDYAINMIHGMLLKKPFYEGIRYTLIEDIKDTEADITLAGHYHSGFGVQNLGGKYFINPGSLVRITNSESEIARKPKVIVLDLGKDIKISEIELKSALPGIDVLDRSVVEESIDRNMKLQNFYSTMNNVTGFKRVDINRITEEISYNQNIGEDVKKETLRRIGNAGENLTLGDEDL